MAGTIFRTEAGISFVIIATPDETNTEQMQVANECFPPAGTLASTHLDSRRRLNRRVVLQGGAAAKPSQYPYFSCVRLGNIVWHAQESQ